jgi:2TM domain
MEYQDEFTRAKKVAGAKIGFYIHLTAYAVVNALLVAINLATSPGYLWFKWPLLGWGIGVFVHAIIVFGLLKKPGIKRRMIEKEMRK